jgi:DNA helicase HerA-like ATPase
MSTPAASGRSGSAQPGGSGAAAERIAQGYATDKPCLTLGSVVVDGAVEPAALVRIPLAMMNRHGLVAGATGTGKTKTLQGIAEQLSSAGVPVIMPDIKGDLTGLSQPGTSDDVITQRARDTGDDWQPAAFPVEFLAIAGQGSGVPVRATVDSFGPILLSKVLGLNTTQESTLGMVVHWCDQQHLPLLDLKDLKSVLAYLTSDEGKADLKGIGGVSAATAGVILRALTNLEAQGGDQFFGEPQFDIADLMRVDGQGRGIISLLEVTGLQARPALYSTFLMWLLAELFEQLPEVGDIEKPKLVFLFDEAHLLFDGASKAFLDALEQTVKLIRSKGVGVFFSTQLPTDVPGPVLSQLGARIQHALRAFTPADQKALTATVQTYPITKDYDLGEALTSLGIGEAIVTVLSDRGAPTPVAWTRMRAPRSLMDAVAPDTIASAAAGSTLAGTYATAIDRESAYELLTQRLAAAQQTAAAAQLAEQRAADQAKWEAEQQKVAAQEAKQQQRMADQQQRMADQQAREQARQQAAAEREAARYQAKGGAVGEIMGNPAVTSFVRSMASALGGSLGRSLFGTRRRR